MASGDTLFKFEPQQNVPPSSNYATVATVSANTGERLVLEFSTSASDDTAIFSDSWPSYYDDGGINVYVHYKTDGTDTGEIEWVVSVESTGDGDDLDADGTPADFGTATNITDTPLGTDDGLFNITAAGAISHANCGSPAPGDGMRLKISRDGDHATTANTDTLQLIRVVVTEQ